MKKLMLALSALIISVAAPSAHAAKVCDATWHVMGGGLQHYIGYFELRGKGHINCIEDTGILTSIPVNVKIGGSLLAYRSAAGVLFMQGTATGLGYSKSPMELLGKYATMQAAAAAKRPAAGATA